ncbi:glycosyltransferase [Aquimarina pacifica]|uniref:glycosyltransferase n=1 Tax=Aquimarina pacifica TaxID=1296415 RepID=UPI000470E03F|nr:glycosyltransferase [Aquimarina pacifica]
MKNKSVCAVIVSYNRKELLVNCIDAVLSQTKKVDKIFIIDNKSTDGTFEYLKSKNILDEASMIKEDISEDQLIEQKLLNNSNEEIKVSYIRKALNDGGAGGFYRGMKLAYDEGFEWIWLMDDDGLPKNSQLENLVNYSTKYQIDFSNALVLDIDEPKKLSFDLRTYNYVEDIVENDIIEGDINPFNGTLLKRSLVHDIGFLKKEMFIWGDEAEYIHRAKKANKKLATIVKAIHYHPKARTVKSPIIPFLNFFKINIKEQREEIYYRNKGYIAKNYFKFKIYKDYIKYGLYYSFRLKFKDLVKVYKAYYKGIKNDFN